MPTLNFTDRFMDDAAKVQSTSKRNEIRKCTDMLADLPEIGSSNISDFIVKTYGANVRKFVVRPFLIVYDYDQPTDEVNLLGLVHGRQAY